MGKVTCTHMQSLALGNLVSGSLNVRLKTQYPCGYNYSQGIKEDSSGSITPLNKEELMAPKLPGECFTHVCTHIHTCAHTVCSDFLFL